ncbi:MAG: hypothetical protein HLUCCO03_03410 [Marinobacter sp. HL-58]|nr:MAG: hypothetical protein HLUCCO03_03410 [Marinobacter sp. HL-58]
MLTRTFSVRKGSPDFLITLKAHFLSLLAGINMSCGDGTASIHVPQSAVSDSSSTIEVMVESVIEEPVNFRA